MLMGNLLSAEDRSAGMATRECEPAAPPFGIAHATVVPTNFDPDGAGDEEARTEG